VFSGERASNLTLDASRKRRKKSYVSPETHLLASWIVAAKCTDNPRDCRLITLAGVLPDLDGLGILIDAVNQALGHRLTFFYDQYHHYLLHGALGGVLISGLFGLLARAHWRVAMLALVVFHVHLLCDFVGSRGPARYDLWPIHYLGPFSQTPIWLWRGQWRLDGWQNQLISVGLLGWALWLPTSCGHSVVGLFSRRADTVVVGVLRKWRLAWVRRSPDRSNMRVFI
jgi:inner membrane protein